MAFRIFIQVFQLAFEFFQAFQLAFGHFYEVFSWILGFFRFFATQVVSVGLRENFRFSVGCQDFYSGFSAGFRVFSQIFSCLLGIFSGFLVGYWDFSGFLPCRLFQLVCEKISGFQID